MQWLYSVYLWHNLLINMIIPVLSAFGTRQRPSILVKSMQRKNTFITISASAGVMVNLCDVFHLNRRLLYCYSNDGTQTPLTETAMNNSTTIRQIYKVICVFSSYFNFNLLQKRLSLENRLLEEHDVHTLHSFVCIKLTSTLE